MDETRESSIKKGKMKATEPAHGQKPQQFAYFISRGVELLDSEERMIGEYSVHALCAILGSGNHFDELITDSVLSIGSQGL